MLKVCWTPGPIASLKLLYKVCLKRWRKEKKSMTGPGQPTARKNTLVFVNFGLIEYFLINQC